MNKSIKAILFSALILTALPSNGQTCKDSITQSTPTDQFTQNGDGTVTDKKTNLTWMRCSLGQTWDAGDSSCTDTAITYNWQEALTAASGTDFAEKGDWRLPNIKELTSITEQACYSPRINEIIFPNTLSDVYWSNSQTSFNPDGVWTVNFNIGYGSGSNKSLDRYVRLVRGGQ
jgi:hypothetical protein